MIKDTSLFDVLVGYFYTSGFHALYKSLEATQKIRILIGISTNKEVIDLTASTEQEKQYALQFSHAETKELFSYKLVSEMEQSPDSQPVEEGILKFKEWLISGKLEIKAYPAANLHAKLYIMSFAESDRDKGRVITGSSNFTKAGLVDNLEFNVELKNPSDYEFALQKFNELWQHAVDIKDQYIETIQTKTWLNDTITPYQLYLKFLYEYFKDELHLTDKLKIQYIPQNFKHFEYQDQAVRNAKKILEMYGGVFLSDVVGLGKTYMSAMLANQLTGRNLVIASPILLDEANPGSWPNVFKDFNVPFTYKSRGKLDQLLTQGVDEYSNVFIDEAHHFRTETNITYEKLARICRGKRVVLVTATPLNNKPADILSQIKLFQNERKSTIPNVPNLKLFFGQLEKQIKQLDKKENYKKYIQLTKENSKKIRESVLKYLMVRRTRTEIEKYFIDDLKNQNVKFPEVKDPEPLFYQFNKKENEVFHKTIDLISKQLKYARYMPLIYYKKQKQLEIDIQSQKNLGTFMKILLVKRLESSFCAFKNSIQRFIKSYELFLRELNAGHVYISKDYSNKIFDFLNSDDDESIQKLLNEDKAKKYPADDFTKQLKNDLKSDLEALNKIQALWINVKRDPKVMAFVEELYKNPVLKTNKLIVFTESKETAEYLGEQLDKKFAGIVLVFTSSSSAGARSKIIENFDPHAANPKNDYRILIATEVLAEGVNLHCSNVVINYDIPWNPTRLMQRVGRINRIGTKFNKIYTFNFFPTEQSNDIIKLKETAQVKIEAFINLLGADARLLTEEEIPETHKLFSRLISKKTIIGEDEQEESELKYLTFIKQIRNNNPDLFSRIKHLPKKARTAKKHKQSGLLTYFRKGKIQKFFLAESHKTKELDFINSAKLLESQQTTQKESQPKDFYNKLKLNKAQFNLASNEEKPEKPTPHSSRDIFYQLSKILKTIRDFRQYTEEQEDYLKKIIKRVEDGSLPKQTAKTCVTLWKQLNPQDKQNSLIILGLLQKTIPPELLKSHYAEHSESAPQPKEVILSEYLIGE